MIELHVRPLSEDDEGWTEVCLVTTDQDDLEASPEGETVGHIRLVEETVTGPVEWWDARVVSATDVRQRRFLSQAAAMVSLAFRSEFPVEAERLWGW